MCLLSKKKEPKIAKKPIVVYKIYQKGIGNAYISAFQNKVTYVKQGGIVKAKGKRDVRINDLGCARVYGGYLHAYFNLSAMMSYFDYRSFELSSLLNSGDYDLFLDRLKSTAKVFSDIVIMEMEVLAGVEYYKGVTSVCEVNSVAARELKHRRTMYNFKTEYDFTEFIYNMRSLLHTNKQAVKFLKQILEGK